MRAIFRKPIILGALARPDVRAPPSQAGGMCISKCAYIHVYAVASLIVTHDTLRIIQDICLCNLSLQ